MKTILSKICTGLAMVLIPLANWAQAPDLGTTSGFALFTSNGAVDNVGASDVTGNIGTDIGALTGFPPGTIYGAFQVNNAISAQAATDVNTAYTELGTVPCGTSIGVAIGAGQVLTPGVYCLGGASALSGDLTLDGQGDPNALFIFKIAGAFSSSALSNILLTNSAFAYNVYWQISGAVELGANSVFKGTMVADGAINFMNGSSLLGRGLSIQGAISLETSLIDMGPGNPLPIELTSFTAKCEKQNIVLRWSTASEMNNDYFTLESSINGIQWKHIAKTVGAGNSVTVKHYAFIDKEPYRGISYYRLSQTDVGGNFKTYQVISVVNCLEGDDVTLTIFPNPVVGLLHLELNIEPKQVNSVEIFNSLGRKIFHADGYQKTIDLLNQPEGLHFIYVDLATHFITKKFLLRK